MSNINSPLLNWKNDLINTAKITKHSSALTSSCRTLQQLSLKISSKRVLGLRKDTSGKTPILRGHNFSTSPVAALISSVGVGDLPQFISSYYPELKFNQDWIRACAFANSNLADLESAKLNNTYARMLFVPSSKFDTQRDEKKLFEQVYKAVLYLSINQLSAAPLTTVQHGFYLKQAELMQMLNRPTGISRDSVRVALVYLRIAGLIRLAHYPDELTPSGTRASSTTKNGKKIVLHNIYILNAFSDADLSKVTNNFFLSNSVSPSKFQILDTLGDKEATNFPDLVSGVSADEIKFLQALSNYHQDQMIIASFQSVADTISAMDDLKSRASYNHLSQALIQKSLKMEAMSVSQAKRFGYELSDDSHNQLYPASKVLVNVSPSVLRICIEKLAADNDALRAVQARMHK